MSSPNGPRPSDAAAYGVTSEASERVLLTPETAEPAGKHAGAAGPWSDTLGRAASRAAQILLLAAVLVGVVWLLLRVSVVVIATLVALILASAVYPLVQWLVRKGWTSLLATGAAFVGTFTL